MVDDECLYQHIYQLIVWHRHNLPQVDGKRMRKERTDTDNSIVDGTLAEKRLSRFSTESLLLVLMVFAECLQNDIPRYHQW